MCSTIEEHGYSIHRSFYSGVEVDEIITILESHHAFTFSKTSESNLLRSIKYIETLSLSSKIKRLLKPDLGDKIFSINAIVLDKTIVSNWSLDWHQDLKIPVKFRGHAEGFHHWTNECGIHHVVPPDNVLRMRTSLRIHLDECNSNNGSIMVISGTHKQGKMPSGEIERIVKSNPIQFTNFKKGDVMVMKPLLLHKSPFSLTPGSRRILQIDYAAVELLNGMEWHYRTID